MATPCLLVVLRSPLQTSHGRRGAGGCARILILHSEQSARSDCRLGGCVERAVAETGLRARPAVPGHHKAHAEALAQAVQLGGTPVEARGHYAFPPRPRRPRTTCLALPPGSNADGECLPSVPCPCSVSANWRARRQHPGDEAMHWAVLRQALGQDPVPAPSCHEQHARRTCYYRRRGSCRPAVLQRHR